jgi:hypothetical protein
VARVRISTTADGQLLRRARELHSGLADSALIDAALAALLLTHRDAEVGDA